MCTVAYARSCLPDVDLKASATHRRLLDRLPLPDDVRERNWLDTPADWSRIADAAVAWGF